MFLSSLNIKEEFKFDKENKQNHKTQVKHMRNCY